MRKIYLWIYFDQNVLCRPHVDLQQIRSVERRVVEGEQGLVANVGPRRPNLALVFL